ncbi:MAG: mandelate racemase [Rhodospirillaceae bacterium]|nr:MAG: mandelate racemase [Rhodospirillaceae bacterium]
MRIVDIREQAIPISRFLDPVLPSGGLTTSIVAVITDIQRNGQPIIGYGFSSFGRYGQSGLIRERFAPRLVASTADLATPDHYHLDPRRAWTAMMQGEKPGGHGERCVAVGTLDMAIWDAAAKIADLPLYRFLTDRLGSVLPEQPAEKPQVPVYASGGYLYPLGDLTHLGDEIRQGLDRGHTDFKIKIGTVSQAKDLQRIDTVLKLLPGPGHLAVDAMNSYGHEDALRMASVLAPVGLRWFEDPCDPLDFETLADIARLYKRPLGVGEALFSLAEAKLLHRHGGLRPVHDILQFDPVHCYGLTHYLDIVATMEAAGWQRNTFFPHGGHLFALHIVAALGLGGCEDNPCAFQPFGGFADETVIAAGKAAPPDLPGIGFEGRAELMKILQRVGGV